jgi:hypothetical protein
MRKLVLSIPVLAAGLVVFASTAGAGPPASATGTWALTAPPTVTDIRTAGGNTFITQTVYFDYAGDITGSAVVEATVHVKSDGSATAYGSLVCTGCTIAGRTGNFATGGWVNQISTTGQVRGLLSVVGTGGLAGLQAVDHFEGSTITGTGTYSFSYHFEP